jgi:hypothetical protein
VDKAGTQRARPEESSTSAPDNQIALALQPSLSNIAHEITGIQTRTWSRIRTNNYTDYELVNFVLTLLSEFWDSTVHAERAEHEQRARALRKPRRGGAKMAITETDIKLLPVQVKMECYDLCLDCMDPARKKTDPAGMRRALVHNFDDGLTINYGGDYPGGVTIEGGVRVATATIETANIGSATIHGEARIRNLLAHQMRMNGPLHALLTVKPNGDISKPPSLVSDEMFEQTSGASLGQVLQLAEQGVTDEFNIKIDLVDAVAELSKMILWFRNQLKAETEKTVALSTEVAELKKTLATAQDNWRWCNKCEGLFFAGHHTKGVCPADGEHSLEGSGNYRLLI